MESIIDIVITAIPEYAVQIAISTFLILVVGGLYLLGKNKMIDNPFGGDEDDDNW